MSVFHLSDVEAYQAPDASRRVIQFLVDPERTALQSMKLGVTTISAGRETHVAVHEREEIYLVLAGSGWVKLGDERIELRAGSVVAIASSERHQVGASHETLIYAWISSSPPPEVTERRSWDPVAQPPSPFPLGEGS